MTAYGKPNDTGRSSGKRTGRRKKLMSPPEGQPWVWINRDMMESPAWNEMSINGRRLLDQLLLEHMAHAGLENGNLVRPHRQLRQAGLTSTCIRDAIEELEFLGLIRYQRGGRWGGTNQPSRYRLTFYPDSSGNPATNEWKRITSEQIAAWKLDRQSCRAVRRKRKAAPKS